MKHWFLPEVPDLIGMLRRQAQVTTEGLERFEAWSAGDAASQAQIRALEHEADDAKRELRRGLRSAFTTPLDPEDLYELSERLDAVMNAVKNIVREADLIGMAPDADMGTMATELLTAQRHLQAAMAALEADHDRATQESDAAVRACRSIERTYRQAMSKLLIEPDLAEVTGRRELYRRYSRASDAIEAVANRVWYAVVKAP